MVLFPNKSNLISVHNLFNILVPVPTPAHHSLVMSPHPSLHPYHTQSLYHQVTLPPHPPRSLNG